MANPKDSTTDGPDFASRLPIIGPYKAVRVLGEGAMGVVYLAQQTRPFRREVALKLIRPGLGSKQVVARFERERQALALMNHPHVARVYDAGETEDRRPYFVMEHVDGVPVTKYCDTHKLSNTERLRLFLKIGEAVQHAHQKGIIHRDIKPSNILVAGPREQPVPKVIDFGVAKAIGSQLTGDSFATQFGQFVGTPAYMSPEQANPMFEDVDIRSDVYSLGVLLYELISGVLPFDFTRFLEHGSIGEVQRVILEEEPSLPSTRFSSLGEDASTIAEKHGTDVYHLRKELTDDLDSIVMQALEKDRARRYATVLDFTRDVERHLRSEPVLARKQTFVYRARKFIRRRRKALAVAGLAAAFVFASTLGLLAVRSARLANLQSVENAALVEYLEARSVIYSNPSVAADRLYEIVSRHPENIEARNDLAYLLYREYRIDEAIKEAQATITQGGAVGPAHLLLAQIYQRRDPELAQRHALEGKRLSPDDLFHQAMALPPEESAEAIRLFSDLLARDGTNFDVALNRAWRYFELRQYENMLDDAKHLIKNYPGAVAAWNAKGVALSRLGRAEEALGALSTAIELNKEHGPTYLNRAELYLNLGRLDEAEADCDCAAKLDPRFADGYAHKARVHLAKSAASDNSERAQEELNLALTLCNAALNRQPENALALWTRARIWQSQAKAWRKRGDLQRADQEERKALVDLDGAVEREPGNIEFLFTRCVHLFSLRQFARSVEDATAVLSMDAQRSLAYYQRALAAERMGNFSAAMCDFDEAIRLAPNDPAYFNGRARLHRWMRNYGQAMNDHMEVVHLAENDARTYASRGITRWLMGDLDGAIADLMMVIVLDGPEDSAHHLAWLAALHLLRQEPERAQDVLTLADRTAPNTWSLVAVSYLGGECSDEELKLAADGPIQQGEAVFVLGLSALANDRKAEAAQWFAQYVELNLTETATYDIAAGHLSEIRLLASK